MIGKKQKKYFTDEFSDKEAQVRRESDISRQNLRKDISNEIEAKKKKLNAYLVMSLHHFYSAL